MCEQLYNHVCKWHPLARLFWDEIKYEILPLVFLLSTKHKLCTYVVFLYCANTYIGQYPYSFIIMIIRTQCTVHVCNIYHAEEEVYF